ncbi:MAG: hypothetical protein ICCCNLDF_01363 [Planctomycetes bacterium]|nr:hypothetical protein [Planctomycetota bacterium]
MAQAFSESVVEQAALAWFESVGWTVRSGTELDPPEEDGDNPSSERRDFGQVVLEGRLHEALIRLNPGVPKDAIEEAFRRVCHPEGANLVARNRGFHKLLIEGVTVEITRKDGSRGGISVRVVDFDDADNNDWLVVNQYTVKEDRRTRRPDIVVFLNGLPLGVIELKNAANEQATIWQAFNQLQTYKRELPSLFAFNEVLIVSDGLEARIGSLTADRERFMPWRTIAGEDLGARKVAELEVLIKGVFDKRRFLDLLRFFIVFEDEGPSRVVKKLAGYHQFHVVQRALEATRKASGPKGDRRIGVVWHTQGSGKSITMACYAGRVVADPAMKNPTIVVLSDRNDLDGQLFGVFARCKELLRQEPVQAQSRADLRAKLKVAAGGIVFTTIQKFFPEEKGDKHPLLSDRQNVVVIADEAHRSQYDFVDGYAAHMRDALPNASFIGFTGTPVELTDKNTRAVFGEYIHPVYDIQQSIEDGATVPILYESRLAELNLDEREKPKIDPDFEELTEYEEVEERERMKTAWSRLEKLVGAERRVKKVAEDLVEHWEARLRDGLPGKAMIVCMSRRICVDLYNAIVALRPDWHDDDDGRGRLKVIMTGAASDPEDWQGHIRNKARREAMAKRFKDADDDFQVVIVRDMWLTGFDAPSLHTMYLDKPMRGHGLMQAIARVNRVFKDKPGGLVVDYLGIAHELRQALATYTSSGGKGRPTVDKEAAVEALLNKHQLCEAMFDGFDWTAWKTGAPEARLRLLPDAQEHILKQKEGRKHFVALVRDLTNAFALAVPHEETVRLRDDVGFFQAVRAAFAKTTGEGERTSEEIDAAIRQLISRAVISDKVTDIFAAAGLKKPDISILSDDFLAEVRGMPQRNLAVELLHRLLTQEVKTRSKKNVVEARSFTQKLEEAITRYQNRAIEAAKVIEELIALANEMRERDKRGEELKLNDDEVAFYDALLVAKNAKEVLGDDLLKLIAQELVKTVRANTKIDWTLKESVQAKLRVLVKRILRKYGYPPEKQDEATNTVLEQAKALCVDVTG